MSMSALEHDKATMRAVAEALMPRPRTRPSEWVAQNVYVDRRAGVDAEGPMNVHYYPWGGAFLDLLYDHPKKKGVVCMKPSQRGITLLCIAYIAYSMACEGGNLLYLMGKEDEANSMSGNRFDPMLRSVRALKGRLGAVLSDDRRSENMLSYPYDEGVLNLGTAGSPGSVSSTTYRVLVIDEFDQAQEAFPKSKGALLEFAEGRQTAIRGGSEVWLFSHPTVEDKGIAQVSRERSDQGRWVFDCPRCGGVFDPHFDKCIVFDLYSEDGLVPELDSHRVVCRACGGAISTEERQRAVWPAEGQPGGRPGGSGRFWSPLGDAEADGKEYLGADIDGLCDPYRSNRQLARTRADALTPEARQAVLNVQGGKPVSKQTVVITAETMAEVLAAPKTLVLPGGPKGIVVTALGADVQSPRENLRFYCAAAAMSASGICYVTDLARVQGFEALTGWAQQAGVAVDDGTGSGSAVRTIGPRYFAIDDRYESGQVKGFCRSTIYNAASQQRMSLVPVGFVSSSVLNKDNPCVLRADRRRTDPDRPALGMIDMFDLYRHSWVDRVLMMMQQNQIRIAMPLDRRPPDLQMHLTAQMLTEKRQPHNWGEVQMEWDLAKGRRDDWFMAITYAVWGLFVPGQAAHLMAMASRPASVASQLPKLPKMW